MTAPDVAALVAEALEHAEDAVPQSIGRRHDQYVIVDEDRDIDDSGWGLAMMANEQRVSERKQRVVYVRHDAMLAALARLAERCAKAEARGDALEGRSGLMEAVSMRRLDLLEKAEERAGRAEAALAGAVVNLAETGDLCDRAQARMAVAEARVEDFVTTILDVGYSEADSLGFVVVNDSDDDDAPNLIEYAQQIRREDAAKEADCG